jgi:hypothetical protein
MRGMEGKRGEVTTDFTDFKDWRTRVGCPGPEEEARTEDTEDTGFFWY